MRLNVPTVVAYRQITSCTDLPRGEKHELWEIKEKVKKERPNYKHRPAEEQQRWLTEYKADKEAGA